MVKPLLLVAIVANLLMLVLSSGKQQPRDIDSLAPCPPQKPPDCRINEIWSNCPVAVCAPKTCNDVGFPVACPDFLPDGKCPVPPGCICREGFVKHRGICIPMKHCPSCGGDYNAVAGCGTHCNRMCSNYNKKSRDVCTMECLYNACDCRPGLVFDEITGKCVFPSQCTLLTCNVKNEIYDPCPAPCPFRTCGIDDRLFDCAAPLCPGDPNCPPPKCRCRDGYYRNDVGQCVLWKQCPVCRGINEMYDPCPATCPPQNCDVNIALILCAVPPKLGDPECQPGCRCIDNHVRNHAGVCIPREQCPTCPNINEVYDPCIAPCPPRRCDVDDRLIKCAAPPKVGDIDCEAGCRCADGYYRNSLGTCVTRAECPSCDGPHEIYACGGACDKVCATLDKQNQTNCPIINIRCNDKCYCEEGYARDANNICIPIEECPVPKCKCEHEVFSECIQGDCKPKTCTEIGFPVACPRIDPKNCIEGCLCEDGYVRDKNGECIPKDQCPSCGGDCHAVSGCGVHCNNRCSDIGKEPGFCIEICYENSCDCKPGYFFDDNTKKCVHPDKCTPTCGADEIYSDCIQNNSNTQNCSQLGYPIDYKKVDPKCCKAGCLCKFGFVRNDKGVCIPAKQCPSCGGDTNAESGCGKNCGRLCSNYMQKGVVCTLECQINGCDCKKKYVYDTNTKKCVLPKECTPVCKKNEVYSECTNGGCSRKNCSQIGRPVPCVKLDPKSCIKGCLCKEGYLREDNGECVPEKDCKPKCNKPNEYYEPCDYNCPPNTCESLDKAYACPIREDDKCKGQCKCKPKYYRDKKGQCITAEQCQKCMGPKEYFSCGGACDNVCATLKKQNQTNCPIVNIKCNDMCYCEKEYARAKNGTCIPIKDCTQPQCKKNERYEECPAWSCDPKKCCDLGFPVACPDIPSGAKCPVKPACVCVDGYVRNGSGECIPVKDCPSCGGDTNAESGCGKNCGRLCSNYMQKGVVCTLECQINGCDCKKKYVYDTNTKKCVLPKECTPVCKKNEVYSECTNGGCSRKNCSQIGLPVPCKKIDPKDCIKGCLCKEGYLREDNGECVPEKDCKPRCNKPNEYYEPCAYDCPPNTCESLDRLYKCPAQNKDNCKGKCKCKKGYYRNKIGECINEKQCRKCMGRHEYFSCRGACDNVCATIKKQNQTNCPIVNIKCNEMCYCEKDYARAKNGTCIPIKDCEKPQCKKNEVYSKCPAWTCKPKSCCDVGYPVPCPDIPAGEKCPGKPACICVDGYVKNDDGECISVKECPSCGGDENAELGCGTNCGKKCEDLGNEPGACSEICGINTCDCKDGYYYDKIKEKCVLPSECTGICSGKNEVFEDCTNPTCRPKKCSEVGFPLNCTYVPECNKGCVCKEGYVYNAKGVCIPIKQCPSCAGDMNAQSGCGVNCLKKCYDFQNPDKPKPCPKICRVNACDCKYGYYYDENTKKCVRSNKCTPSCGEDEVFDPCTNGGCTMKNCTQLGGPMPTGKPKKCIAGCSCKEGYLRSSKGVCIPAEKCPKAKCKKNEKFMLCPSTFCGPRRCDQLGYPIKCPVIKDGCCPSPPGCICEDDYVKNDKGQCIPKRSCPSCGGDKNAWAGCGVNCGKHCDDLNNKTRICPKICIANSCDCKDGYYYNDIERQCVDPDCCTPPCPENEVRDSCINGGCGYRNCSELNGPILCIDPVKCKTGCTCKKDYLRDDSTGICVPKDKCPPPICPENEVYNSCVNGGCGYRNCSDLNGPELCIDPLKCRGGCSCKEDYLRDDDTGICIPKDQCPKICDNPNEVFVKCPPTCPPQTCESLNKTYHCPLMKIDESDCVGECRCIEGYYRNLIGECILEEDCLKCTGKHNYFSCGPACDNVCCDLDKQSKDNCPIINKKCVERCYCEDGYARDNDDNCVLIEDCGIISDPECPDPINSTVALANFQDGITKLTIELMKVYQDTRTSENIMFSSLSLLIALAKLTLGAIGDSLRQLLNIQNLKCKDEIRVVYPIVIKSLTNPRNVTFEIGNKDYADKNNCPLTEQYKKDAIEVFFSEAENIDFSQNVKASDTINKWVSYRTRGLITDLVKPEMFSSLTRLAIFNVLYFLGNWKYPFDEKKTKPAKFYLNDKDSVMLPMMNQINRFEYGENDDLDAKIIILPYEGGQFKLVIFLPNEETGLKYLLEKLDIDTFKKSLDSLTFERCNVSIPLMDYENEFSDLKTTLGKLGLTAPFEPNSDDFRGIIQNNEPLSITDLIQKTVLKVNEKGTKAAAATGIIVGTTSVMVPPKTYQFNWNHPGCFFLMADNNILFSGLFNGAK